MVMYGSAFCIPWSKIKRVPRHPFWRSVLFERVGKLSLRFRAVADNIVDKKIAVVDNEIYIITNLALVDIEPINGEEQKAILANFHAFAR